MRISLCRARCRAILVCSSALLPFSYLLVRAADEASAPVATLKGHTETVYAIAFTPDSRQVVTGSFDKTVRLWDAATGKELKVLEGPAGHQNLVLSVALSADGKSIASGSQDNTAKIWEVPAGGAVRTFSQADGVTGLALSPDGKTLAGAGKDGA